MTVSCCESALRSRARSLRVTCWSEPLQPTSSDAVASAAGRDCPSSAVPPREATNVSARPEAEYTEMSVQPRWTSWAMAAPA